MSELSISIYSITCPFLLCHLFNGKLLYSALQNVFAIENMRNYTVYSIILCFLIKKHILMVTVRQNISEVSSINSLLHRISPHSPKKKICKSWWSNPQCLTCWCSTLLVVTLSLVQIFWLLEFNTNSRLVSDLFRPFSCNAVQPYCKHTRLIAYKNHFIKSHNVCRQAHQSL